jgi:ABC-type polysaccharide/polyol phosphate transport system ATPase subunit
MSEDAVIQIESLWKRYGFPWLRSMQGRRRRSGAPDGFWALRDISFELRRGETLGIIGRNGAGKSTLLKVLAGVTPPSQGQVRVQGRLFPMIELNAGIHPELTGLENVYFLGAVMGFSRRDMKARMRKIEEFCDLGDWFQRPVRTFSSGMLARLGFAVAMNMTADVLLVDEVLAVGDLSFQNRCLEAMRNHREAGKTILFVSHALETVQYLCQRVIFLEEGRIIADGPPERTIVEYENWQHQLEGNYIERKERLGRGFSSDRFELLSARVRNGQAQECKALRPEEGFLLDFECKTGLAVRDLIFTLALLNQRREICLLEYFEGERFGAALSLSPGFKLRIRIPPIPLSAGMYFVNLKVRDRRSFEKLCGYKGLATFVVEAERRERGMLTVPVRWEVASLDTHSNGASGASLPASIP